MEDKELSDLLAGERYEEVFRHIVREYRERLYFMVRRMSVSHDDTDDILQNIFIKIWTGLPSFREESRLYTWIYRIAANETLSWLSRKKIRSFLRLDFTSSRGQYDPAADPYFSGDSIQKRLYKAIASLPDKQRVVFSLRYFEEMKYDEMSEMLGTSVGALKASYHHAYNKIRKELLEEEDR